MKNLLKPHIPETLIASPEGYGKLCSSHFEGRALARRSGFPGIGEGPEKGRLTARRSATR